ncbi:MAG: amidophosphoribosyltransferase, partial [Patescibacteria group bacterium]
LNALTAVLKGKDVIVIDDSIVRGTTSKKIVKMIRRAGAKKVHMLISSPPVLFPDYYGINTPHKKDLLAARMSLEEVQKYIDVDTIQYLSYDGLIKAIGLPESSLTTSCFTGVYPVEIGPRNRKIAGC